jgi:hypothetical protein
MDEQAHAFTELPKREFCTIGKVKDVCKGMNVRAMLVLPLQTKKMQL